MQSPLSAVVIEYYGGAAGRTGAGETAFAQRKAEYDVGFMAQWTDPAESDKHMAWARDIAEAMKPHSSGAYLLNFLSEEDADTIKAAFGANYPRLARGEEEVRPDELLQHQPEHTTGSLTRNARPKRGAEGPSLDDRQLVMEQGTSAAPAAPGE